MFVIAHTGNSAMLETIDIVLFDDVAVRSMIIYPYSSFLHGRVKKVYKTILNAGNDEWIRGIFFILCSSLSIILFLTFL